MAKRVLITGPESSGKSTLAAQLAQQEGGVWVQEYARTYLTKLGRDYQRLDLDFILAGQLAAERAMAQRYPLVYCDTGPEVLYIWSQHKYGIVSKAISQAVKQHKYDEVIVCYPDLPWEADPLRESPSLTERLSLYEAYLSLFARLDRSVHIHRHKGGQALI